jgi:hypothetical protein
MTRTEALTEAVYIAEEFNKWLEDIAEKYRWTKDEIQELIKQFLI